MDKKLYKFDFVIVDNNTKVAVSATTIYADNYTEAAFDAQKFSNAAQTACLSCVGLNE